MSSSSSSSTFNLNSHQWIYDVFINFRGEDTRKSLVSHLYAALLNAGINTFLDDEKLKKGWEVKPELLRAIHGSQICLVVFSQHYTQSSWCLVELLKIMENRRSNNRQVVIPIFYHVDPSVVRRQVGDFGKALEAITKRINPPKERQELLRTWKRALTQAANISGWDSSTFRSESELVIHSIKNQSSKVSMVGIWGMGGLGKTTIAKGVYNKIHHKFVHRSNIENIRQTCESDKGYIRLQKQLLSDLFKTEETIHNITTGTAIINKRISAKKVLILLDDVTKVQQVKALCGNYKCLGFGSVIIITTRDAHILKLLEARPVCTAKEMDEDESLELFSWHAFKNATPRANFSELSKNVVNYCGGLPLALEILGSHLFERTKEEWKSVLSKLEKIPHEEVQEKLRISYDGLTEDTKKAIFLDVCCFFIGKDKDYVTEILNGCGLFADIGIAVLIERSLLKVEKNNKLGMHDLIRDMGREIVRGSSIKDPGERSRLWFHEDAHDVLTNNTGTQKVEGLILNLQIKGKDSFSTNVFQQMQNMRLLQLDCVDLTGEFAHLSKQLRWVNWQRSTFSCIPNDFHQGNLVVLELKFSNVKQVWKETKLLDKLKILNLSHSKYLKSTPDFSKLPNLEKLIMKDCPSLSEVHPSIGVLKNILLINLKDCTSLGNLPREIYQLISVKTLILFGCSKIDKLEEDIVQMKSLTTLVAANTGIKQAPFSIFRSKSIVYISLCGYEGLSRDVFPSLIWSWMSPTMNSLPHIPHTALDVESNSLVVGYQSSMRRSCSEHRSVRIECQSVIQLIQNFKNFFDGLYGANFTESESLLASQISDLSLKSLLITMGSCHIVVNALGNSLSQGLTTNDSFLPGDNYPSWLAYTGEGPFVRFEVPEDCDGCLKGITLYVVYSSTPENMETECLTSVLIINYTKFTLHIYKQETVMSFNNEDWQSVISNLAVGDNVGIFVAFGHGLTVKKTVVYLIYGQSSSMQIEPSISVEVKASSQVQMEPLPELEVQPSSNVKKEASPEDKVQPSFDVKMDPLSQLEVQPLSNVKRDPSLEDEVQPSPSMKTDPLPGLEMQPSSNVKRDPSPIIKNDPLRKRNNKIFVRFSKKVGECLCLNQNRGLDNF
ncbi:disease resistance protein (TIR-NBS-LRR class) [Medicago truncatula]|uniref:ADP-ribosyl cyclase/cyclic ADP-ribose hydrolase n=1 Tax=Medicago truncatula TaxID=3880 RepID=A0A072TQS9_MEDTR|nr:disease resistance protein (TIR-NBS-LRR class) [Medicago truncatula]